VRAQTPNLCNNNSIAVGLAHLEDKALGICLVGKDEICPLRMGRYRNYNLSVGALRLPTIEGKAL